MSTPLAHFQRHLRSIIRAPKRLRTSRGFGVHSPFAFNTITKVLCDRSAAYYAFPEIDALCGKSRRDTMFDNMIFSLGGFERQEARMIFRLICAWKPEEIIEIGGSNEVSRTIIDRAAPHARLHRWSREDPTSIQPNRKTMIMIHYALPVNFTTIRSYILEAVRNPAGTMICFRNLQHPMIKRLWNQLGMVASFGMSFHDDLTGIYFADPRLPRQNFELNL